MRPDEQVTHDAIQRSRDQLVDRVLALKRSTKAAVTLIEEGLAAGDPGYMMTAIDLLRSVLEADAHPAEVSPEVCTAMKPRSTGEKQTECLQLGFVPREPKP